jgi:hypothetical protein
MERVKPCHFFVDASEAEVHIPGSKIVLEVTKTEPKPEKEIFETDNCVVGDVISQLKQFPDSETLGEWLKKVGSKATASRFIDDNFDKYCKQCASNIKIRLKKD